MSNRIFAGGLPWEADQNDLKTAFEHFGPVEDAKVIMDKDTGKSRGFGFVTFGTEEEAAAAVQAGSVEMDVGGRKRTVRIQEANERPARSGGGGGSPRGGSGREGRGSGGGGAPERDDRFEDSSGGKGRGKSKGSRKGSRGGDGGGYNDGGGYHSF